MINKKIKKIYQCIDRKIKQSVQFELMILVGLCFIASLFTFLFLNSILKEEITITRIKYDYEYLRVTSESIARHIEENRGINYEYKEGARDIKDIGYFDSVFSQYKNERDKVFIADLDGNVLIKTDNVDNKKVDIFTLLKGITEINYDKESPKEFTALYPISINNEQYYLIYKSLPNGYVEQTTEYNKYSILAIFLSLLTFIALFLTVTKKKIKYIHEISEGLKVIAEGDLGHVIPELGEDEISRISKNINIMSREVNKQIEAQKIAEKSKSDLITSVSHDLRTPLTSIMGYIGLLKEGRYDSEESMNEYLDVAFNKSKQLKVLIEDLFEYTKVNNSGMSLNKSEVNLVGFISQISEEMRPYFEENNVEPILTLTDKEIVLSLDVSQMVRAIENLFTNAVKYSYKPGKIIIGIYEKNGFVTISVKNKGDSISEEKLDKLFDKFYRLEESRNTNTGGSGLGLAISKTIVEKHGGEIWAECYSNDISFNIRFVI